MLSALSNLGKTQSSPYPQQLLHITGSMATQLIQHLTGEAGRKPQQRGRDSEQAPDVDFLPTETLPSCLFPPLFWRCHLLHGATTRICAEGEGEEHLKKSLGKQ